MTDNAAHLALTDAALRYAESRDAVLDYVWELLLPLMPASAPPD